VNREKKQRDWLATITDDITNQSHSLSIFSREKITKWKTGFVSLTSSFFSSIIHGRSNPFFHTCFAVTIRKWLKIFMSPCIFVYGGKSCAKRCYFQQDLTSAKQVEYWDNISAVILNNFLTGETT
jgi:hypothetical protein